MTCDDCGQPSPHHLDVCVYSREQAARTVLRAVHDERAALGVGPSPERDLEYANRLVSMHRARRLCDAPQEGYFYPLLTRPGV